MRTQRPTTECDRCQSVQEVGGGGGLRVEVEEGGDVLFTVFSFFKSEGSVSLLNNPIHFLPCHPE